VVIYVGTYSTVQTKEMHASCKIFIVQQKKVTFVMKPTTETNYYGELQMSHAYTKWTERLIATQSVDINGRG